MIATAESPFRETPSGVAVRVRVLPRSAVREVVGIQGNTVRVKLSSPPVAARANEECRRFIASVLGVAPGRVAIATGDRSRLKTFLVHGVSKREVEELFDGDGKFIGSGK